MLKVGKEREGKGGREGEAGKKSREGTQTTVPNKNDIKSTQKFKISQDGFQLARKLGNLSYILYIAPPPPRGQLQ